jgi:hypothetical protein
MMNAVSVAVLVALAYQVTTMFKYLSAGQIREVLTALIPWAAAFVVLLLGAAADATADLVLPGFEVTLGSMDVASLAIAAASLGSTSSVAWDFKKAFDNTDSASVPPLGGGTPSPT